MSQPIPIDAARSLAETHGFTRLVIWAYAAGYGQHVTTWGGPALRDSHLAAEAGNAIKAAAGWAEDESRAIPQSFLALFAEFDAALSDQITKGTLQKGTVLAILALFRDVVRARDPQLAEQLIPTRCEAAAQPQPEL